MIKGRWSLYKIDKRPFALDQRKCLVAAGLSLTFRSGPRCGAPMGSVRGRVPRRDAPVDRCGFPGVDDAAQRLGRTGGSVALPVDARSFTVADAVSVDRSSELPNVTLTSG